MNIYLEIISYNTVYQMYTVRIIYIYMFIKLQVYMRQDLFVPLR